jgi:hypothetical protein
VEEAFAVDIYWKFQLVEENIQPFVYFYVYVVRLACARVI